MRDAVHPIPSSTGVIIHSFIFFFSFVPLFPDCQIKSLADLAFAATTTTILSSLQISTATPPPPPNGVFNCVDTLETVLAKIKVTGITATQLFKL